MKDDVPRGPRGRRRYAMDYIPDRNLHAAVSFALELMRQGKPPGLANTIAAESRGVAVSAVAHYTGQAAGTKSGRRRRP
jgi:hypothetical protein